MADADSHVEAWLASEPGAAIALRFCPARQRGLFGLWGVLLDQIDATRFDLVEPVVMQAKLAWWCEELQRGTTRTARHPVMRALLEHEASRRVDPQAWSALGGSAWIDASPEATPADLAAAIEAHAQHAARIAAIESVLFAAATPADSVAIGQWLRHWRGAWTTSDLQRWRWPLQSLARHQVGTDETMQRLPSAAALELYADVAHQLHARLLPTIAGGFWRRWRTTRDRWQLREWRRGRVAPSVPGPFRSLWSTWSAARAADPPRT